MSDNIAIRVDGVSKSFKLPHEKHTSIKGLFINLFRGKRTYEKQEALKNINFEVKKGEFFGIVGRNGSGKSTLLKLLAGIYSPNKGHIHVNGKLTPFIELGVGFNPELTGRENVFLNGALLGFNRSEMETMYGEIVAFAELENFMDQKLKNYSSGMQVRLAFSIAIRANTDILILDEVLAVGDQAFQEKCYRVFEDIKQQGKTIVFISHDGGAIERFCDRVMIVNYGKLVAIGSPKDMVLQYGALLADEQYKKHSTIGQGKTQHQGNGSLDIKSVEVLNNAGKVSASLSYGEPFSIEVRYVCNRPIKGNTVVGVEILDDQDVSILGPNTKESDNNIHISNGGCVKIGFTSNYLSPKMYSITVGFFNENLTLAYDLMTYATQFKVVGKGRHGKIHIEPQWSHTKITS